ncbi:hypothetical protein GA8_11785 [Geobacillus sp. A8]|nr:hypothetical protein GA8_11785 [Geobacillus sp. A8]
MPILVHVQFEPDLYHKFLLKRCTEEMQSFPLFQENYLKIFFQKKFLATY